MSGDDGASERLQRPLNHLEGDGFVTPRCAVRRVISASWMFIVASTCLQATVYQKPSAEVLKMSFVSPPSARSLYNVRRVHAHLIHRSFEGEEDRVVGAPPRRGLTT